MLYFQTQYEWGGGGAFNVFIARTLIKGYSVVQVTGKEMHCFSLTGVSVQV